MPERFELNQPNNTELESSGKLEQPQKIESDPEQFEKSKQLEQLRLVDTHKKLMTIYGHKRELELLGINKAEYNFDSLPSVDYRSRDKISIERQAESQLNQTGRERLIQWRQERQQLREKLDFLVENQEAWQTEKINSAQTIEELQTTIKKLEVLAHSKIIGRETDIYESGALLEIIKDAKKDYKNIARIRPGFSVRKKIENLLDLKPGQKADLTSKNYHWTKDSPDKLAA